MQEYFGARALRDAIPFATALCDRLQEKYRNSWCRPARRPWCPWMASQVLSIVCVPRRGNARTSAQLFHRIAGRIGTCSIRRVRQHAILLDSMFLHKAHGAIGGDLCVPIFCCAIEPLSRGGRCQRHQCPRSLAFLQQQFSTPHIVNHPGSRGTTIARILRRLAEVVVRAE